MNNMVGFMQARWGRHLLWSARVLVFRFPFQVFAPSPLHPLLPLHPPLRPFLPSLSSMGRLPAMWKRCTGAGCRTRHRSTRWGALGCWAQWEGVPLGNNRQFFCSGFVFSSLRCYLIVILSLKRNVACSSIYIISIYTVFFLYIFYRYI